VGDWLQYADGADGIGRVLEINWRATHLVTIGEVEVIVPNGVIAKAALRNFSRPTPLMRQVVNLIMPDPIPPQRLQTIALDVLGDLPGVRGTPPPSVLVGPFVERGTTYSIRYYIDDFARAEPIEGELRKRLWYRLRRDQIELPPPRTRAEGLAAGGLPTSLRDPSLGEPAAVLAARLTHVDFLAGVSAEVVTRLAQGTTRALYGPGEVIVREGDSGNELFVIERGIVEVLVVRSNGPGKQVAVLHAGQFFGEAALLRDEQRSATVVAQSECQLLVIAGSAFRAAAELDGSIAERLTTKLALRLTELRKALSDAADEDDERRSLQLIERVKRFFQG
jgi:CRP-like cAMP-binding protein